MSKTCRICGKEFKPQLKHGENRQYCYTCVPNTCVTFTERVTAKARAMKREGVRILGGKCLKCGETRYYILEFHHINPKTKKSTLSNLMSKGKIEEYFIELQKCILLCSNCHKEYHFFNHTTYIETKDYVNLDAFKPNFSSINRGYEYTTTLNINSTYTCSVCHREIKIKKRIPINFNGVCNQCSHITQRKCKHPDKETLTQEITQFSFEALGRKYGVTGNAVKKWCKKYGIPHTKKKLVGAERLELSTSDLKGRCSTI